jgi:aspartyl-tRNA(Asn)/glutamyl-tRNA(Gln) amidotransferase subunit C
MLNEAEITRIAMLARIKVTDQEKAEFTAKLNGIFGLVEQMRAVDTQGVEPMSHALDVVQRLREDVVTEVNRREQFQAISPQTENGLYLVPKVIE